MSRSLRVFVVEQFGHANKESTSDEMDKSLNLNHVGNIESFGSSLTQSPAEIVEGSITLSTFVKS